jgi:hypothetical protein
MSDLREWIGEKCTGLVYPDMIIADIQAIVIIRQAGTAITGVIGCKAMLESEMGIFVPRWRVEDCLRSVDPEGAARRLARIIYRREYYVPYVNSLWHIDGHHKLIRWGIVIHMAVDGKSRMSFSDKL